MSKKLAAALLVASGLAFAPLRASAGDTPAWIAKSNEYTQRLLLAQAQFDPESAAQSGLEQFDGKAIDLGPDRTRRMVAAEEMQRAAFAEALKTETDPQVMQDLQILIGSTRSCLRRSTARSRASI